MPGCQNRVWQGRLLYTLPYSLAKGVRGCRVRVAGNMATTRHNGRLDSVKIRRRMQEGHGSSRWLTGSLSLVASKKWLP